MQIVFCQKLKFLFKYIYIYICINPNQNSTITIKGELKKHNTKTNIQKKKKKLSTLIRIIRKNKNPPKEIISNLYKIKWGEEESKYKKEKEMKEV